MNPDCAPCSRIDIEETDLRARGVTPATRHTCLVIIVQRRRLFTR